MFTTKIINRSGQTISATNATLGGKQEIAADGTLDVPRAGGDAAAVQIRVPGKGSIQVSDAGGRDVEGLDGYWKVLVESGDDDRYFSYDGDGHLEITVNADGTYSANAAGIQNVPIGRQLHVHVGVTGTPGQGNGPPTNLKWSFSWPAVRVDWSAESTIRWILEDSGLGLRFRQEQPFLWTSGTEDGQTMPQQDLSGLPSPARDGDQQLSLVWTPARHHTGEREDRINYCLHLRWGTGQSQTDFQCDPEVDVGPE